MANATVYFATNRVAAGPLTDWRSYGAGIVAPTDPTQILYASAFVDGIDIDPDPGRQKTGTIIQIVKPQRGDFDAGLAQDIVGSGRNLLIFLHGFANAFGDAITRAAFNREWFAAAGGAADTTIVAFTWPSLGTVFAPPPQFAADDYFADQSQASLSGFHIASFFGRLRPLIDQVRRAGRRVFLLAHSMGNYALQSAVANWFAHGLPAAALFDEAVLAAADERYDSFELHQAARLSRLRDLAGRISIYCSDRDRVLDVSILLNWITRMGHDGPESKTDTGLYPPAKFRIVDCAAVSDYSLFQPIDASHQYYRRSARVRADIAAAMARDPTLGGGLVTL